MTQNGHRLPRAEGLVLSIYPKKLNGVQIMSIDQFIDYVESGLIQSGEGVAYYATSKYISNLRCRPSSVRTEKRPDWVTHVAWSNH